MAAEEIPAWVSCAQCEIASATLECIDEELLYCAPCSASLHSKRARLHHSVKPFQTCDECEAAVARVRCASCAGRQSEPLVFCIDCSALLHSKKARHHHQVQSISSACMSSSCKLEEEMQNECKDEKAGETIHNKAQTEDAIASGQDATQGACMRVAPLSCQQRFPLTRTEEGHSKQGPSQSSKQDSLLSNARDASTRANPLTDKTQLISSSNAHNTQKAALNTTEDDALLNTEDPPLQEEDPLINALQEVGIVDRLDVCKEGNKNDATLTETEPILEAVLTRTEVDGIAFMKKSAPSNMQEATQEEVSLTPTEMAYVPQKAPLSSKSGVASECTQEARGHDALLGLAEGVPTSNTGNVAPTIAQQEASVSTQQHNGPSSSVEEAAKITMANASKEAQLLGGRPGMQQSLSQIHFAQPPFQSDHMQLTPDCHHPHSHFHTQSPCQAQYQGPHTPPPFQSHLFPHCTPLIPRHLAGSTWPVRAMDFSHNAFHGNQYNAGFMTPACQSYALVSPPGYMPYSNPCYAGFFPQVDHSSSAYTPQRLYEHSQPIYPHENFDSIHSKSNDRRQGPGSNKRLWSNLYEVPTCDKGGEAFLSKKMHIGEGPTSANSPNLVNGEGAARTLPTKVHGDSLPEESSKKLEETCTRDTSSLEKGHTSSSPGEAISEKDSKGKSFGKVLPVNEAPCDELQKASPSIVSEVLPERPDGKDFMPEVLLEKVSATETCGKISETAACSSGAASEQPPNVLTAGMQLDDCLLLRTPIINMPVKSVAMAKCPPGEVWNEKLAVDAMSNEVQPPPGIALDDCIPLKKPSTGLVDKVIPVARVPIGEVQNEKLVSESLSSDVLSEMVHAGTLPARAPSEVPLANLLPKEEPVDLMPGGDELSEFADTFVADKDSPRISLRSKIPSRDLKEINPKEECAFHESNVAHKYPTNRLTKVSVKRSLQVTQSPSPDMSKEEENSRDSSEPSFSEGDTSADDETFNTKKYRRGTITLEATVMKRSVHDASNAVTERIRTNLKRGLCCSTSDDDAREALRNAQRQLTKYNLKQASAFEGSLLNSQALKTGSCVVEFVCTGSSQRGRLDCWTYSLAQTVAKYFATDFCAQRLNVIFYGISQNAYCAGHAFAATYNRIAAFSADYIPEKLLDQGDLVEIDRNWECPNKGVFSRKSRLAYKNGLVEMLFNIPKWQRERRAVKAERVETGDGVAHVPIHSVWMEGVPKNASLVKKHGYKTMEALTMHCRKACKAFIEKNNWTIVASKLKYPILW